MGGSRVAAAAGVAIGLAVGYNIANVGPAAQVVSDAYGVRLGFVGLLTTALFVTHLVMQIPGGKLVDRRGARTLAGVALGLIVIGNAGYSHLWPVVTTASVLGVVALSLLELFVAFLQAYVFVFLTALFMGMALHPQH